MLTPIEFEGQDFLSTRNRTLENNRYRNSNGCRCWKQIDYASGEYASLLH